MLGIFGLIGLLLTAIGVYGVISFAVRERNREIGIRLALGATPGIVLKLVVGSILRTTLSGVVIGLVGGLAIAKGIGAELFGVTPTDPWTYLDAGLLILAVALVVAFVPAKRAVRIDPISVLRYE